MSFDLKNPFWVAFEKEARQSFRSIWKTLPTEDKRNILIGAGLGGVAGAAAGQYSKKKNKGLPSMPVAGVSNTPKFLPKLYSDVGVASMNLNPLLLGASSAILGGIAGLGRGHLSQASKFKGRMHTNSLNKARTELGLSGKEKTKQQVKAQYRDLMRKHHPDVGGNVDTAKKITSAYGDIQKSDWFQKLSSARFLDAFEKEANSKIWRKVKDIASEVAPGVAMVGGGAGLGYGLGLADRADAKAFLKRRPSLHDNYIAHLAKSKGIPPSGKKYEEFKDGYIKNQLEIMPKMKALGGALSTLPMAYMMSPMWKRR